MRSRQIWADPASLTLVVSGVGVLRGVVAWALARIFSGDAVVTAAREVLRDVEARPAEPRLDLLVNGRPQHVRAAGGSQAASNYILRIRR